MKLSKAKAALDKTLKVSYKDAKLSVSLSLLFLMLEKVRLFFVASQHLMRVIKHTDN